ncbi:cytochrome c and c1 heme-lyase [Nadsonia fulvescens var. elongata DSM 6958]|uniref:Holocytochrome c-type synthase n=1 Tax=Nadsonia fulvescens var. elongata DSM 6958 TaxID=857566 RepID=A0A1E3PPG2_9ASCO|nr:cytochrome c and c1 heme-lyase [Nadsonia fulvescens var. elongata DSM 6958]
MGWFWSDSNPAQAVEPVACPVNHGSLAAVTEPGAGCPVDHETRKSWFPRWGNSAPSGPDASNNVINPLNNMPDLSSQKAPGQVIDLPTERTLSSIPRGSEGSEGVWEYPSPQQMLNAMLRKGGSEIPEDAVESMVDVHNFLNEGAWDEILKWEAPHTEETKMQPRLLKFTGRPNDATPRSVMLQALGKIYPSKYGTPPPFDRHDWTVLRGTSSGEYEKVRYVIDYYSFPDDEAGNPSFVLDVRPALDTVTAAKDRFTKWTTEAFSEQKK